MSLVGTSASFAAGVFLWTFLEYVIHDYLGHRPMGRHKASREHLAHHAEPDYFMPWTRKIASAVPVLGGVAVIAWPLLGLAAAVALAAGVGAGWTWYEALHRSIHTRPPRTAYGRWARRHHLHHHFSNQRDNHGVTTPLWDIVFGTRVRPEVVRVPRRHASRVPWLEQLDSLGEDLAKQYGIG